MQKIHHTTTALTRSDLLGALGLLRHGRRADYSIHAPCVSPDCSRTVCRAARPRLLSHFLSHLCSFDPVATYPVRAPDRSHGGVRVVPEPAVAHLEYLARPGPVVRGRRLEAPVRARLGAGYIGIRPHAARCPDGDLLPVLIAVVVVLFDLLDGQLLRLGLAQLAEGLVAQSLDLRRFRLRG